MINKALSYIGLAKKAGRVSTGAFLTERLVKSGRAELVIVACDASLRTKKDMNNLCRSGNVELIEHFQKDELGELFSKEGISAIGISDNNFKGAILRAISETEVINGQN